jgi:hypothetical protein
MSKKSTFTAAIAIACSAAFAFGAAPADAQSKCKARDSVIKLLGDKYQEAPVAIGVTSNGKLVEVLSSDTGETWTILITSPEGVSCLVAAGEGWREAPKVSLDPEA